MTYEKATIELIQFDNSDVITTSNCRNNGQDNGNGCKGNSGDCQGQSWK